MSNTQNRIEELEDPTFMQWKMLSENHIKDAIRQISKEKAVEHPQSISWPIIAFGRMLEAHRVYKTKDYDYKKDQLLKFMHKQDTHRHITLGEYIPNLVSFLK